MGLSYAPHIELIMMTMIGDVDDDVGGGGGDYGGSTDDGGGGDQFYHS